MAGHGLTIKSVDVFDVRFPTSLALDGSDAMVLFKIKHYMGMHTDPDYSCAYVILSTEDANFQGHGFTFTIGRGTEIVVNAIATMGALVTGRRLDDILENFGEFWKSLTNESQLRWLGPEKGVIHLATAALVNAVWDLWAKLERKPLWKLLCDMEPERLIRCIDFRYLSDSITREWALELLKRNQTTKAERGREVFGALSKEKYVREKGIPAYVTSVGWMGYSNEKIASRCHCGFLFVELCETAIADGWTRFKMKVGVNVDDDKRRAALIRQKIGPKNLLMMDANQKWDVAEAISWMQELLHFKPLWIEEPTSPDDVLGHSAISKALKPHGVGVATGEHCQNRVMFKQFLDANAMQFCQIDSCRLGGVNEVLAVLLLAAHKGVPVCPHAGGVGLCELVQHLAIFNFICVAPSLDNVMVEFADHLHEHFVDPVKTKNGSYVAPLAPGYSAELRRESLTAYVYPNGSAWQALFEKGLVRRPNANTDGHA